MLVVPIEVRTEEENRKNGRRLRRESKSKENMKLLKVQQARMARDDRRKDGVMYAMEKNKLEVVQK